MVTVQSAYSARAAEYAEQLGTMKTVHPSDRQLVTNWAESVVGPAVDAGCGPGHWTHYLAQCGLVVEGVDFVPEFIQHAREQFPGLPFRVGSLDALGIPDAALGGVLCWYSLIHEPPETMAGILAELARAIRPDGSLLVGFFEGSAVEAFPHAVVTAYRWPVEKLSRALEAAGFEITETHSRTGAGYRPHGAIIARRV